jgi:hypothetical protein
MKNNGILCRKLGLSLHKLLWTLRTSLAPIQCQTRLQKVIRLRCNPTEDRRNLDVLDLLYNNRTLRALETETGSGSHTQSFRCRAEGFRQASQT